MRDPSKSGKLVGANVPVVIHLDIPQRLPAAVFSTEGPTIRVCAHQPEVRAPGSGPRGNRQPVDPEEGAAQVGKGRMVRANVAR